MKLQEAVELIGKSVPRAYLVGGFVRDELLGIESKDADIEVFGMTSEELEKKLHELFDGNVETVGRSFGVFKVMLGDGVDVDVAIPRRESKSGKGHKDFVVEGDPNMNLEEASARRDFTINAMYRDLKSGELMDPFGGADDLKKKILKVVDAKSFVEDPLRVYRAVQFVARFGLTADKKTFTLMKKMVDAGDLDHLPAERVTGEIKKLLLQAVQPSIGFELMHKLGIIEKYYPELLVLEDTDQEPDWHPEGNVWIHTMMVVDQAAKISRGSQNENPFTSFSDEERLQIVLGALCHDLGKPSTTAIGEKDGVKRIRSLGHEEAGIEPTKSLLKKFTFGQSVEEAAIVSAREHLKPGMLSMQMDKGRMSPEQYANAVRKLLKRIQPVSWRILLAISESDYRGRTLVGVDVHPYEAGLRMERVIREQGLDQAAVKPLVQGRDLLEAGLKPGPRIGEIIGKIEEARDEGKIRTREEALEMAKGLVK